MPGYDNSLTATVYKSNKYPIEKICIWKIQLIKTNNVINLDFSNL